MYILIIHFISLAIICATYCYSKRKLSLLIVILLPENLCGGKLQNIYYLHFKHKISLRSCSLIPTTWKKYMYLTYTYTGDIPY